MERVLHSEAESDRDLIARCRGGDNAAFDALVRRHQQRALNVAFQLLRNQEDAVEVAQDAFVSIYRHIGEFRGDCEFTTWLHQIVVNLARNKHRWWHRRGRQVTVSMDCPLETDEGSIEPQLAGTADPPDVVVVQREYVQALQRTMGELPADYREALVLRNVEELSYEEIAKVLGISLGTVKSRIARARDELRKRMDAAV